jgi:membrane protein required for colicin V production
VTLNWLDIVLILITAASVVAGIAKGFARIGIGLAAAIAGVILGVWFYGSASAHLLPFLSSRVVANLLGFWIVFLLCVIAGALLGKLLGALFRWAGLGWMDRLLGAAVGLVRGLAVGVAIILALTAFATNPPPASIVNSQFAPYLLEAANLCAALAPRELKDAFSSNYEKVKELWSGVSKKQLPEQDL